MQNEISVFYDEFEEASLWGRDLYDYLFDLYHNRARYCVMFISESYAAKLWTTHERKAAQARAFQGHMDYILPVRLDDTAIPGLPSTIGYRSCPPDTPATLADAIMTKLGRKSEFTDYLHSTEKYTAPETGVRIFCSLTCSLAPIPCLHAIKFRPRCIVNSQEPVLLVWDDFTFISLQPNKNNHIAVYYPTLPIFGRIAEVKFECKVRYGYVEVYKYEYKERLLWSPIGILSRIDSNPSSS